MLSHIPVELQLLDQWVIAGPDKLPINPTNGQAASVTDPSTWATFEQATAAGWPHVGFVLSCTDPFTIIDLDDPITSEQTARHQSILSNFQTYAEVSQSGRGVHLICRGAIPKGVRRDKVEIYSDSRYMICTGRILKPLPIVDCQSLLDKMFEQMNDSAGLTELHQVAGILSDEEIFTMARHAVNSHKFEILWSGDFSAYPSQSEADFALLSMLCFYTRDNEQVRRLFRLSGLGKREKATRNNKYIDFALSKCRAKELPLIDFTKLFNNEPKHQEPTTGAAPGNSSYNQSVAPGKRLRPETDSPLDSSYPTSPPQDTATKEGDAGTSFPPGLIGEIADYIFSSSIRPVREISLAAALALVAGIAGRTYNISGMGLNQYLILLARTGSGKEGAAKGIDSLVQALRQQIPTVDDFIGPSAFASGQALIRVLDKQPCFVSVLGEFGFTLQQLCDPNANSVQVILKKVLLDIYAKSGWTSVLRSSVYSETEKNTKVVQAPNVTFLGESTPESFYDNLDSIGISQGLIPRFSIFEYTGPRPVRNLSAGLPPQKSLVDKLAAVTTVALAGQQSRNFCQIMIDAEALSMLDAFDEMATGAINDGGSDVVNQLWNRAHLKALKLAGLVAVGINPHAPVVTRECADWACSLVERDISKLLARFSSGDVGQGDMRQEADLRNAIEEWLGMGKEKRKQYKCPDILIGKPIVPIGYLRRRLRLLVSFKGSKMGASHALNSAIKYMCEAGELQQVAPLQAQHEFKLNSPLYIKGPNW